MNMVFDIGGVLVDWQPHLAWADVFESRAETETFMERVSFRERNLRADGGALFAELAAELEDAEDARLLAEYPARYAATVRERIEETWDILDALKTKGVPVHAITNWSAETWPVGLTAQPSLGEVFETLVVSGQEGMLKPQAEIFELFCKRAGVAPEACIFTDDGLHNVEGAKAIGMEGIHFTSAGVLRAGLEERGVL